MFDDLLGDFANATATFYTHDPDETATDPYAAADWTATHTDIDVRYDSQIVHLALEDTETGTGVDRADRLYAPLAVGDDLAEGDRVDVTYRGTTHRWRIEALAPRSFDDGDGFYALILADFDD